MNSVSIVMMNGDEHLYVNLKIIARLEAFQRINTRASLFKISPIEQPNNYLGLLSPQWLQRWWSGSSRESDFSRIRDLYVLAFERLDEGHDTQNLRNHLDNSMKGLINLKKTYETDMTLICRLETLQERVRKRVSESK